MIPSTTYIKVRDGVQATVFDQNVLVFGFDFVKVALAFGFDQNLDANQVSEKKAELAKMSFNHTVAGTENPMVLRAKRREIARIHTVINEMKNNH
ncbi:MAG: 50S ribosomal protein L29 [Sediminibacterium sp.]